TPRNFSTVSTAPSRPIARGGLKRSANPANEPDVMKLPTFPVEGGCQCRAVRYRISAPPLSVYNCYCRDCQRASGGTHTMSSPTRADPAPLLHGEPPPFDKPADSGRIVRMLGCARCGTKVWNEPLSAPALLVLKPGTLDDMSWAVPVGGIWTAKRAP